MAKKYDADSIVVIRNDRDRVRQSPNMYIPNRAKEGAVHCYYEIIDNSVDELTIPDPAGSHLKVTFDKATKECTVEDDGRGIPHEKLYDVLTVLAASGKFNNTEDSAYLASGGAFGHGATAVLSLSKYYECSSTRNGKKLTYYFKDGLKVDQKEEKAKGHGTFSKFTLDPSIIDTSEVTENDIKDRLEEKSYVFPDINITLTILNKGKEVKVYTFGGKTIRDRLKKFKLSTDIIEIHTKREVTYLKNITDDDVSKEKVKIDLVFAYSEDALDREPDDNVISYANTIKTYAGGVHVEGVRNGIQKFMKNEIIPKFKGHDKDLNILPSDMISGLCMFVVVALSTPEFRGQEKTQLSNQEVKFAVRDAVYEALCDSSKSIINPMVDFIKRVTRGRLASKKTRKKDVSNVFSKDRLDKFKDIIYNLDTNDVELILVEGDSAADNAAGARDPHNQAIYPIKRPANIFDTPTDSVNKIKSTFNDILDICGIEPGKKCDPSKSTMHRILMMTDGDVDGDDIAISTVCLLAKHCRPLVDAGMVGRILPPAYSIPVGNGKRIYVRSQREFFDKITKKFISDNTVSYKGKEFTKKELREFLEKNFEYDTKLKKLADRSCCDPKFMEYIAWSYHGHVEDQKRSYWQTKLKIYPGLSVLLEDKTLVIDGDIQGSDYINLALDEYFDRHVYRFKKFQQLNRDIFNYEINDEKDKTIYDVMHLMRTYIPKGVERFKGLGELSSEEMRDLCLNPKKRTVVIFKFKKDLESEMKKINVIMSTKKEYAEARKRLLMNMTAEDIDLDT